MIDNSNPRIKKFPKLYGDCKEFDEKLAELQDVLWDTAPTNEQDFEIYTRCQVLRDYLFIFTRKLRGVPDPENLADFIGGGGEVVR